MKKLSITVNYNDDNRSLSSVSVTESSSTRTSISSTTYASHLQSTSSIQSQISIDEDIDDDIDIVHSPCDSDPFWDYYITISNISRANIFELLNAMKFISAQHIVKGFIQDWLQNRIKPKDLHIYDTNVRQTSLDRQSHLANANVNKRKSFTMSQSGTYKFDLSKEGLHYSDTMASNMNLHNAYDLNLHSCALTKFIQKSLKNSFKHPNYFHIPLLIGMHSNSYKYCKYSKRHCLNNIGTNIFSFLDQSSFVHASMVSRSWFYVSRFPQSRTHIQLSLLSLLKYFTKHKHLFSAIMANNDIICFNDTENENCHNDATNDILLTYMTSTDTENELKQASFETEIETENNDILTNFSHFFRQKSALFSQICLLQMDLNIIINNCLIYYIDDALYDHYWEIILILFGIPSLKSIDLILIDPHLLLLSYVIKTVKYNNYQNSISMKQLKFPSIGFKNKKGQNLYKSAQIKSLSFKCKSLSTNQLCKILNTHFKYFCYKAHHSMQAMRTTNNSNCNKYYSKYRYYKYYKSLDSYILCRKIITKPLIFDITHALDSHNLCNVESLTMYDTRCACAEFEIFLLNNSATLQNLEIIFSEFCLLSNATHKSRNKSAKSKAKLRKTKSNTMLRIVNYLNDIFNAVTQYLNISIFESRVLALQSLAVSFPMMADLNRHNQYINGFFKLFQIFEAKSPKLRLKKLYLNGTVLNRNNFEKLHWEKIFKHHTIEALYLREILYFDSFFEYFSKLWSHCLVDLHLQILFQSNANSNSIQKMFKYLANCHRLENVSLDFMQRSLLKSSTTNCERCFAPMFDILWLHSFMTAKHIKNSLKSLQITFNEISTQKFENNKLRNKKFENYAALNYGEILRINSKFKIEIEELIMSWFSFCPHLIEIKMIRKLSSFNGYQSSFEWNKNCFQISCFEINDYSNEIKNNCNGLVSFEIKKWKIGNLYKGNVIGDIDKLLMPEIPVR